MMTSCPPALIARPQAYDDPDAQCLKKGAALLAVIRFPEDAIKIICISSEATA